MKYYILSFKWTHRADLLITFWRANRQGYTWIKSEFGIYSLEEAEQIVATGGGGELPSCFKVEAELVFGMAVPVLYGGKVRKGIPMNDFNLQELGIKSSQFWQKHPTSWEGMEFILEESKGTL